ncbi:hypothetical protein LOK49_LG02G00995 [Camellia lanceoleosa]|uniref:Uncharacterized protein n=1 Tax=Camellia lanceoleosa TaxID=1840588 RepID=A0ACC0IK04_9ERIC|nr:hypothetical protein LOK49_LG02G00995 [Camellia lanceoleosa]
MLIIPITVLLVGILMLASQPWPTPLHHIAKWISAAGAINDCLIGEAKLAHYFLAVLNLSDEYKQWSKLSTTDFVVHDVRRTLFEAISSFHGNLEDGNDLLKLIEAQFAALRKALRVLEESDAEDARGKVAAKLLNLYRTGRLGHYTLDPIPMKS